MLVDAHTHCYTFKEFPAGERWAPAHNWAWYQGGGRSAGPFIPPIDKKGPWRDAKEVFERSGLRACDEDGSTLIKYMDSLGIQKAVIMGVDWGVAWGEEAEFPAWEVNKRLGQLKKKYAGRLYFQTAVDPRRRRDLACEMAETAIRDYGASGIKILAAHGIAADDPRCFPLYDICRSYGKTVTVHTASGDVAAFVSQAHVWHMETPAKLFPDLQFVAAHGGGTVDGQWNEIIQMCWAVPNIAIDFAEWQYEMSPSPLHPGREEDFIKVLHKLRMNLGAHNIMWATDFMPSHNMENTKWWWDLLRDLPARAKKFGYKFWQEEADLMGGDNARRIYETG